MKASGRSRLGTVVDVSILAVLAFLVFGPSGVVGGRLTTWHADWRQARTVRASWDELVATGSRVVPDGASAERVVVEFVDYECRFCRQVAPAVEAAATSHGVTLVVRHFPLEAIHPHARPAARAAVCGERFGAFARIHERLLADDDWQDEDWARWAANRAIEDVPAFESCMNDIATDRRIDEDVSLGERIGVEGNAGVRDESGSVRGLFWLARRACELAQ